MVLENYQFNYSWQGNREQPVILFLHGFMGDRNDFNEVINCLSTHFCCLTVDLPGHGNTKVLGNDEYYNMPNTAQALIELLKINQINQCFLVGYSLGGRLALYLTIYFPDFFKKVVLESASPGLEKEEERQERLECDRQLAVELETINLSVFLEQWYSNYLFTSLKNNPNFTLLIEKRLKNNPQELAKSLKNISTGIQPSLWQKLKQNRIDLLLLVGELDLKFIIINKKIAQLCPKSSFEIIKNSGHNTHFENPFVYAQVIKSFCLKQI